MVYCVFVSICKYLQYHETPPGMAAGVMLTDCQSNNVLDILRYCLSRLSHMGQNLKLFCPMWDNLEGITMNYKEEKTET